jgi:hypothetical protein
MTVETRTGQRSLSILEHAVLEAIAYGDVFDYPLTREEIWRALPVETTLAEVDAALAPDGSLAGHVVHTGNFHTLAGRDALFEVRRHRAKDSSRLMRQARTYGSLIARLPFVRMVAVSGSLAVDNAEAGDDIDYLIVTAPGRVWLARSLITLLAVRLARLRGLTVCPNYVLSESALALPERDAYTARELLQMRPIAGQDVYTRMLAANAWCRDLLPNWRVGIEMPVEKHSLSARFGERLLGGRLGDSLERWLLRRKGGELRRAAGDNTEAVFDETVCKGHFEAHRARLEVELSSRLGRLEVEP